jgi:hypothetical protein
MKDANDEHTICVKAEMRVLEAAICPSLDEESQFLFLVSKGARKVVNVRQMRCGRRTELTGLPWLPEQNVKGNYREDHLVVYHETMMMDLIGILTTWLNLE